MPTSSGEVAPGVGLAFAAIGDWGGQSNQEPTTESQRETAGGLTRQVREMGANFSLLLGDNFYEHGVDVAAESSCRFRETFEEVYAKGLPDMPFYVCAGNHDYGEGVLANVSSQLDYSRLSSNWKFPSLWYKLQRRFAAAGVERTLDLLMIDTVVLCGNGPINEAYIDQQLEFLGGQTGKARPGALRQAVAEKQWAWLREQLAGSAADFLLVAGHYPIWSGGNDGSSQCLIDRLRPMLMENGAHYLSGHDHMLEHFEREGLNTFVIGAGKECCYDPVTLKDTPAGALRYMLAGQDGALSQPRPGYPVYGGFATFSFDAEFMRAAFHAHDGSALYAADPLPRRKRLGDAGLAAARALTEIASVANATHVLPHAASHYRIPLQDNVLGVLPWILFAACWATGAFSCWRARKHDGGVGASATTPLLP